MRHRRASTVVWREATSSESLVAEIGRLRGFLWNQAVGLLRNQTDADDLVQDTVERALAHQHLFRPGTSLKAWTRSIMRNLFIDGTRRRPVWVTVDLDQLTAPSPTPTEPGPLDLFRVEDVLLAAGQLRGREREMFNLAHVQRLPYQRIAERFHMRADTVGTRLFRIRRKLRAILERSLEQPTPPCIPLSVPASFAGTPPAARSRRGDARLAPRAA
jgi:RNA polymerase sigma-70 factor, ECF subfamily